MRGPFDDFTPIELELLKHVWVAALRRAGFQVNDDFTYLVLC